MYFGIDAASLALFPNDLLQSHALFLQSLLLDFYNFQFPAYLAHRQALERSPLRNWPGGCLPLAPLPLPVSALVGGRQTGRILTRRRTCSRKKSKMLGINQFQQLTLQTDGVALPVSIHLVFYYFLLFEIVFCRIRNIMFDILMFRLSFVECYG